MKPLGPPDETSADSESAIFLVDSTVELLRALDASRHRSASGLGISASGLRVMSRLADSGLLTPSQLSESMNMTTGALTAIGDSLAAAGLVQRNVHPHDRRRHLLSLTALGSARMAELYREFGVTLTRSVERFSQEQHSALASMMIAMAAALNARAAAPEPDPLLPADAKSLAVGGDTQGANPSSWATDEGLLL